MKKLFILLISAFLLIKSNAQVVRILNSNLTPNDSLVLEISSNISSMHSPCGKIISIRDTLIADTLWLNNHYNVSPFSTLRNCTRTDTIRINPLPAGLYYINSRRYWTDSLPGTFSPFYYSFRSFYLDSFIVSNVTALKEYETPLINIYPNPTKDLLYLEGLNESNFETLEIINIQGQLIIQEEVKTSIDVSNLPSGVYFLRLVGDRVYQQKFVKD